MIKHNLIEFLELSTEIRGDEGEEDRKTNLEVWYVLARLKFADRLEDADEYIILSELENNVSEKGRFVCDQGYQYAHECLWADLCIAAFHEALEVFPDMEDPRVCV